MLLRIAEALETRSEDLACRIALETGNALRTQARPEARLTADIFRYFGGLAGELKGETIPLGELMLSYTRREPIGVVGAIIPWNAPVLLGALKIAPALCAGNTIVLKAAEDAPLGVLLVAEICREFLPRGVLNVLTGLGEECAARWRSTLWSASSLSPARPRSAKSLCARRRSGSCRFRSNSAARARPSFIRTPMRIGSLTGSSRRCALRGRANPALPDRACSYMPISLTASSTNCGIAPRY